MRTKTKSVNADVQETIELLQKMRQFLNLTQRDAAERSGIPLSTYQKFETGERNFWTASFTTAYRVLYALELSPDDFFCRRYIIREPQKECPVIIRKGEENGGL